MAVTRTDVALGFVMVASLVVLYGAGEQAFFAGLFAVPPVFVPCFFALPLCQAFLDAMSSARDAMSGASAESPRAVFKSKLRPRFLIWLLLWSAYVVALEGTLYLVAGGGNLIVSVPCVAMALVMIPSCFIWSARCRILLPLVCLTILTPPIAFLLAYVPALGFVYVFDLRGYMDIGLVTVPPLIASLFLVVAVVVAWTRFKRMGDAWFEV